MTAKVVSKNFSFGFSVKNYFDFNMLSYSDAHLQNLELFVLQIGFLSLAWMEIYCYWTSFRVPFNWFPVSGAILGFKSEQNLHTGVTGMHTVNSENKPLRV